MQYITAAFAQQIVDSAKAVVGWNINFIDTNGIIIASTDPRRIGKYHEAGHKAAKTRQMQEVSSDALYKGSHRGLNYPIIMNDSVAGVIGITGDPDVASQYGFLLTKICELFLKEYWLEARTQNERHHARTLVQALLYHDMERARLLAAQMQIPAREPYIVTIVLLDNDGSGSEQTRSESIVADEMNRLGIGLYTPVFPNEIGCLIPKEKYEAWKRHVLLWQTQYRLRVWVGMGTAEELEDAAVSYRFAKAAVHYARAHQLFCMASDSMNLELLLQSADESMRTQYGNNINRHLRPEDRHLLTVYFETDLSLQETARLLTLHKNTLQYRLKKIRDATGLDPRKFTDAVVLYVALHLH